MDAGVVGDFRMEGGREDVALLQRDGVAAGARHDMGLRTHLGHEGAADEHKREIADDTVGIAIGGEGLHILGRGERPELTAVRVTTDGRVEHAEIDVRIVVEPFGEQDHAGAGAEGRLAGRDMRGDRGEQTGGTQQLALRRAFAAGKDDAVDRTVEILGRAQQLPRRAETVEHRGVFGEGALHGEDAGDAMRHALDAVGMLFGDVGNVNNHGGRPSLAAGGHDRFDLFLVDADHRLTEVLGQAGEEVRILPVRGRLDNRGGALRRVA